ncbi:MAG: VWA domain-containing protein, partial [Planctomycetaceae bacterium]|nr:VWA domain-containing protein [Planctomycetaceae bacterium]
LAQTDTGRAESFRTIEIDYPETTFAILAVLVGLGLLIGLTVRTSLRDSRFLAMPWRVILLGFRLSLIAGLLWILLNPRQRTQTTQIQPSRVGVLVDTSLSMAFPAADSAGTIDTESDSGPSRSEAVLKTLIDAGLLKDLAKTHAVSVYTFGSELQGPVALMTADGTTFVAPADSVDGPDNASETSRPSDARVDLAADSEDSAPREAEQWRQLLQPNGSETRLGESLHHLIGQMTGRTLSGIVVLTDGRSNAGLDTDVARLRAERSETRLITIGVGSEQPQTNVWLAGMQSPTDVHRGDPFDITVLVQGIGAGRQQGRVRLFQQSSGSDGSDRREVAESPFEIGDDGLPVEITFRQQISVPGKYEYIAAAELLNLQTEELSADDNQRRREVEVTDRKQKVLIISSGPMRDYQFVRNTLYRHSGIESDVWLQTVQQEDIGFVSQEAEKLLTSFPRTEAELFEYDVIVAFDADWSRLSKQQQEFLNRWVDEHSGGIIFVAGELFTPEMARDPDKFRDIAVLYPV